MLPDGKIPELPPGCHLHSSISKDEKHKYMAEVLARELERLGFEVWLSRDQDTVNEAGMKYSVEHSAAVVLVMSPGIFQDRYYVTQV